VFLADADQKSGIVGMLIGMQESPVEICVAALDGRGVSLNSSPRRQRLPQERKSMRKIRDILRLHFEHQLGQHAIATSVRASQSTVSDYLARFQTTGLGWPLPESITDQALEQKLFPPTVNTSKPDTRPLPDFAHIDNELRQHKHVTLQLLWDEYRASHAEGYSYSRFCRLFEDWAQRQHPVMRQIHRAGEKMFVDWAGDAIPYRDRESGVTCRASLFVAVLGASSYTYAEATADQKLDNWIGAHIRAFEFFQGVTELLVPDNTKTAVTSPCFYDPDINLTYQEMAMHYHTGVLPARVGKPRHKAKVEAGVLLAERWLIAALRHADLFSVGEINQAIGPLLGKLNRKPFRKREGSRATLFAELDKPALRPLPATPYDLGLWHQAKVNIDYHVAFDHSFYSVPHQIIGQRVDVRSTPATVEIFHNSQRVASHLRAQRSNSTVTEEEHRPRSHRLHTDWPPSRIVDWAGKNGPATAKVVEQILASKPHPEMGYRSCLGIIRLGQRYSPQRLEAAAERALTSGAVRYKSIESMLRHSLDQQPLASDRPASPGPVHDNIRGPEYFACGESEKGEE
jgi:transposase